MMEISWQEFSSPIWISLKVSLLSSIVVFLLGVWAAWGMADKSFKGKSMMETLFILPLVLPPSVVGFVLLMLIGRKGWIGQTIESWFGMSLIFSWWAAVIASVVVAFPLVYQTVKLGFSSVDRDVIEAARCQGAGEWQLFRYIRVPLAAKSLKAGYILGFARGLGEFGATIMIAGNIPGRTQTIPTAIYGAVDSGKLSLAWYWSAVIILISLLMLWLAGRPQER
jgi:molybdate transport system permease protein